MSLISDDRLNKIRKVVANRQFDLTVILERVSDPHNIGAVLRSCDSIGLSEVFLINDTAYTDKGGKFIGKTTSSGAWKWIKLNYYKDCKTCITEVKKRYGRVLCTHMSEKADNLYELDLTLSTALVFGNESDGISDEMLSLCDGNFLIPQVGMVQSLNISVACAVSLYEAFRQRSQKGLYSKVLTACATEQQRDLFADYLIKHKPRVFGKNKSLALKYLEIKE